MKKQLLSFVAGVAVVGLVSFRMATAYEPKNSTAEVDQFQGFYIFTDAKPVQEYKYLGTVKVGTAGGFKDPYYEAVKKRLAEDARKAYPEADGLIIKSAGYSSTADAIKIGK